MIMRDLDRPAARLPEMVQAAEVIVPFTGAGISTECGSQRQGAICGRSHRRG